jgi:hypothetical protein
MKKYIFLIVLPHESFREVVCFKSKFEILKEFLKMRSNYQIYKLKVKKTHQKIHAVS